MVENNDTHEDIDGGRGKSVGAGWRTARNLFRAAIAVAVIVFFVVLSLKNVAPFGASVEYHVDLNSKGSKSLPSPVTPSTAAGLDENGVFYGVPQTVMDTDMVGFILEVPYSEFDHAEVKLHFRGDPHELLFGMRGDPNNEYEYLPVNNSSLNGLAWNKMVSNGLTLYQKGGDYGSVEAFLSNPPLPGPGEPDYTRAATYCYDMPQPKPGIDTARIDAGTAIGASLRGPHAFYVYVGEKPLHISFVVRELNWKEGPDPLAVQVFSGSEIIWATGVPDDGDEKESRAISAPREVDFSLEGLEEGAYEVRLVCETDTIIQDLRADQGYMSFIDDVFIADHELYDLGPSRPATVFTDAMELNAWTWHPEAFQTIDANGDQYLDINAEGQKFLMNLPAGVNEIHTQMGDISLLSRGSSFAFSREALFDPLPLKTQEYSEALLYTDISYIIAAYTQPQVEGDWLTCDLTFDLRGIEIIDGKLQCLFLAPNLMQNDGKIVLGAIDIVLVKDGGKP